MDNLTYIKVKDISSSIYKECEPLFISAFPEEERPPLDLLISLEDDFYNVYKDGTFCGLVDLVHYNHLLYIFFLAIEPSFRGQGLGSKILKDIVNTHKDKTIFLSMEEVNPKYEDYENRKRRTRFYKHNDFLQNGVTFVENNVTYELVSYKGKQVSVQDLYDLMKNLVGEEIFKKIYQDK